MGMIDITWTTLLHRTEIIARRSGCDFLAEFPALKSWRDAVMATGIPQASVADDFEEKFSAFYLADTTYLGQLATARNGSSCDGDCECTVDDLDCCA